jgi:hypothetical protein
MLPREKWLDLITPAQATGKLADEIDDLYAARAFKNHRAALRCQKLYQGVRNFVSHPPKNAKEATQKIKKCRTGFLEGVGIAKKLYAVASRLNDLDQTDPICIICRTPYQSLFRSSGHLGAE